MKDHATSAVPLADGLPTPRFEALSPTRPLLWSIRRELWEHRSITLAPLWVAGFSFLGALVGVLGQARRLDGLAAAEVAALEAALVRPFSFAPAPIMLTAFVVGVFYALDALHGERRDRSILFWKSLPVSDRTTVLAKAAVPLAVLPLIAFVLSVATLVVLLLASTVLLAMTGSSPASIWSGLHFVEMPLVMLYGLAVHALWFAPIYGWLLLVSAWARRLPVLWAILPPPVVALVEKAAFGTSRVGELLAHRVTGAMAAAFDGPPNNRLDQLTPLRFLGSPGFWLGLLLAAACLAGAVRLRRLRAPI